MKLTELQIKTLDSIAERTFKREGRIWVTVISLQRRGLIKPGNGRVVPRPRLTDEGWWVIFGMRAERARKGRKK